MSDIHDDLSPEDSQRLKELSQALREEFTASEAGDKKRTPIKDLEDLRDDFLKGLKHIVNHSDSDALKAKVAMWGYDKLLDSGKVGADPLRDLLEGLESATPVAQGTRENNEDGA